MREEIRSDHNSYTYQNVLSSNATALTSVYIMSSCSDHDTNALLCYFPPPDLCKPISFRRRVDNFEFARTHLLSCGCLYI